MSGVDVDLSDAVKAAIEVAAGELAEGGRLIEEGIESIREGASLLDRAGVVGSMTLRISLGEDSE